MVVYPLQETLTETARDHHDGDDNLAWIAVFAAASHFHQIVGFVVDERQRGAGCLRMISLVPKVALTPRDHRSHIPKCSFGQRLASKRVCSVYACIWKRTDHRVDLAAKCSSRKRLPLELRRDSLWPDDIHEIPGNDLALGRRTYGDDSFHPAWNAAGRSVAWPIIAGRGDDSATRLYGRLQRLGHRGSEGKSGRDAGPATAQDISSVKHRVLNRLHDLGGVR